MFNLKRWSRNNSVYENRLHNFEQQHLSDFTIQESSDNGFASLALKWSYKNKTEIELIKCIAGEDNKLVIQAVAEKIINIWDANDGA